MNKRGRVIGVDVEIRHANRERLEQHEMFSKIELIEGSSIDPAIIGKVANRIQENETVLVILDSDHDTDHVFAELKGYCELVTAGSYVVVMDGAQGLVDDIPRGNSGWRENNPLVAIEKFVQKNDDYEIDRHFNRMHITSNSDGFLRRRKVSR